MNLVPVSPTDLDRLLAGDTGGLAVAPGWPHEDTEPGLSFVRTGGLAWLICDDDGRVAGECGTKTAPDDDGAVEIGYGLAPQSRGRGLGTSALKLLLAELAAIPAVRRIDAQVHVGNTASQRMLVAAGFTEQGRYGNELCFVLPINPR
jgi:RimJ/RimL family protein N-acetyltransferase